MSISVQTLPPRAAGRTVDQEIVKLTGEILDAVGKVKGRDEWVVVENGYDLAKAKSIAGRVRAYALRFHDTKLASRLIVDGDKASFGVRLAPEKK